MNNLVMTAIVECSGALSPGSLTKIVNLLLN